LILVTWRVARATCCPCFFTAYLHRKVKRHGQQVARATPRFPRKLKMKNFKIRPYKPEDEKEVIALWRRCNLIVPWNSSKLDIERKLQVNPEMFLVGLLDSKVVVTVMGGYDGHRGWVNYLAVSPNCQQTGLGRKIMSVIEDKLKAVGCPKINLQIRSNNTSAVDFYERVGYSVEDLVDMGKRLVDDTELVPKV